MNLKKWRLGMRVAVLCGVLTAVAGLTGTMDWKSFVSVLAVAILTNLMNWLKEHPVESIDDTRFITKPTDTAAEGKQTDTLKPL